jgi:tetratricopeptide (TPR) repeat protein
MLPSSCGTIPAVASSSVGLPSDAGVPAGARPPARGRLVGARYHIINELGRGGMGWVYRALDRLTGRVVTLKRLKGPRSGTSSIDSGAAEERLALAGEFRLVASLRHPNIISVLDYGFDESGLPYFTMDLQEDARTIVEAGTGQPLAVQVELLVQTLRALIYLHRHGIIHRDLKPENVLVVRDHVKVLDFGLSFSRDTAAEEAATFAGTVRYMAPEMLRLEPPSERSDLYAVGMIAYELFTGGYPFEHTEFASLCEDIVTAALPRSTDVVDPRLRPILERLLAKSAESRYRDASEVVTALAVALDQPLLTETVATRESFLQAAPLVGRRNELAELTAALRDARSGKGAACLVVGESGVGKSRLLDEIRTRALVDGMIVLRGQGKSQGGGPYHVWQDVVSGLVIRTDVSDGDAAILKTVFPDIARVLGRDVPDAPAVDPEAAQSRLLFTVEQLLRQQRGAILAILEDLQWAGSESLRLWNWLADVAKDLQFALLGTVRDDEAPDLAASVTRNRVLKLQRLTADEIAELSDAMIGPAGRRPDLVGLLERETEGIPFFVVEVVRTLAERAGGLNAVAKVRLPERVVSGGVERFLRRRVKQVRPDALPALETAAVIGRLIDPALMNAMHPDLALDAWAAECAGAAVLELRDEKWRFAHDKLREQLLQDLSVARRRALHQQVAEAIEHTYASRRDHFAALAHHWHEAGEPSKEGAYANMAGVQALQIGACREAILFLTRARDILQVTRVEHDVSRSTAPRWSLLDPNAGVDPDGLEFRLGMIEAALTDAHFRIGDLRRCREHAERALAHFGQRLPRSGAGWLLGSLQQAALRALQSLSRMRPVDPVRTRRVAAEIGRVYIRLAESFIYSLQPLPMLWSTLRFINHCEAAGPSVELAIGYVIGAMRAEAIPARAVSRAWCRRALAIGERTGHERDVAFVLSRLSTVHIGACRWEEADAAIARATEMADRVMDHRLSLDCRALLGALALFSGQFDRAFAAHREGHRLSLASGTSQTEVWGLLGQADSLSRLGRYDDAVLLYEEAADKIDEEAMRSEAVWRLGMLALTRLRMGEDEAAYELADRALSHLLATSPVIYYMQHGVAATADVFLSLLEAGATRPAAVNKALRLRARQACASMRAYGRRFPLCRPHQWIGEGRRAWLQGHRRRAMRYWRRAITLGERLRMPYERALAHLEIGRHLPLEANDRRHHLHQAAEIFERLGCAGEVARARDALAMATPAWA